MKERDIQETALAVRAKAGDDAAVRELYEAAKEPIRLAVKKHLGGCCNDGAVEDATAACKEAFMRSLEKFEPSRGTSIRTVWYYLFRRAVVGYVRATARRTTRECALGGLQNHRYLYDTEASAALVESDQNPLFRDETAPSPADAACEEEDAEQRRAQLQAVAETLEQLGDTPDTQAFVAWAKAGYSYGRAGRDLGGVDPRTVEHRVSRVRAAIRAAIQTA